MARLPKNTRIATPEARKAVKLTGEIEWHSINEGLFVGYRRTESGGTWWARRYQKRSGKGRYEKERLGIADDRTDADGQAVLDYKQAVNAAIDWSRKHLPQDAKQYSVNRAADNYLAWFRLHKKSFEQTERAIAAHIRPTLGSRLVADLTTAELRAWFHSIAENQRRLRSKKGQAPAWAEFDDNPEEREDELRRRKSSANRLLTVLKAVLNFAHREHKVGNAAEWKALQPFYDVDVSRKEVFESDEWPKFLAACGDDFRALCRATLLCGFRYGEVVNLVVADFDAKAQTVRIVRGKTGGRIIHLSRAGVKFFQEQTKGKSKKERIFLRADGTPWGKSDQHRPMKDALADAKLSQTLCFYSLRHTYGTQLAAAGVPLKYIAEQMGNSVAICAKYYAHASPSEIARMVNEKLPSFG